MAPTQDQQLQQGVASFRAASQQQPNPHAAAVEAAMHKANKAQVKLSAARGKMYAASHPVHLQDQHGRWTTMPHSQAEQHVKGAKKNTRGKRVAGKQQG
jgi:hypothetical protein